MSYFSTVINKGFILQALLDGKAFFGEHLFSGVAGASNADMLLQIGANNCLAAIDIVANGGSTGILYEAPTNSAVGTAVTLRDMNRVTANVSPDTLTYAPTITAVGDPLEEEKLFAAGDMQFSADRGLKMLWLLKANTDYLIRATNDSGANEEILITVGLAQVD